jgi:hypothetical protein
MTDNTLSYGSFIPEEFVTTWYNDINEYELLYAKELFARNIFSYRSIGPTNDFDMITYFNSGDDLAQVIAKGATPDPFTARARTTKHEMFCIAAGFVVNERDLIKPDGATMKSKELDIALDRIHGKEDYIAINGDTTISTDLLGILGAARANELGKLTAAASSGVNVANMGAWAGGDDTRDPYEDIVNAIDKMQFTATPYGLVGNRHSLRWLNMLDSERDPFTEKIAPLFGKAPTDRSWMIQSQFCPDGYVYLVPKSPKFGEFVVSEEITIADDYPKMPGGNYWIEIKEWINPAEIHQNTGYVEIQIT